MQSKKGTNLGTSCNLELAIRDRIRGRSVEVGGWGLDDLAYLSDGDGVGLSISAHTLPLVIYSIGASALALSAGLIFLGVEVKGAFWTCNWPNSHSHCHITLSMRVKLYVKTPPPKKWCLPNRTGQVSTYYKRKKAKAAEPPEHVGKRTWISGARDGGYPGRTKLPPVSGQNMLVAMDCFCVHFMKVRL